jgi:hypothetical protein
VSAVSILRLYDQAVFVSQGGSDSVSYVVTVNVIFRNVFLIKNMGKEHDVENVGYTPCTRM